MKFKTNINCEGITWKVDTENPDKILTVNTETVSEQEIIEAMKKAGFEINLA